MRETILDEQADVLILTEADTRLELSEYAYSFETEPLEQPFYKSTERRVIIYSQYPILGQLETYDPRTACCPLIETPMGIVAFYGTIVGIYGNREPSFQVDLKAQIKDWKRISETYQLCIAGDLNMSFQDNYYFTKAGRMAMKTAFTKCKLENVTGCLDENIDHIVLSKSLANYSEDAFSACSMWNLDKSLSDHIGVSMFWMQIV